MDNIVRDGRYVDLRERSRADAAPGFPSMMWFASGIQRACTFPLPPAPAKLRDANFPANAPLYQRSI